MNSWSRIIGVALLVLVVCCHASYRVGVAQYESVFLSTDAATAAANTKGLIDAVRNASAGGANLVVLPEFALGMADGCNSTSEPSIFCEPLPPVGTNLCAAPSPSAPIASAFACAAQASSIWVSLNTCQSTETGNYNAEVIFDSDGAIAAVYLKMHPWRVDCFNVPPTNLVTITPPFAEHPIGVFTCYDILFPSPGPALVAEGIHNFIFSAAIPLVDSEAMRLWSWHYSSSLFGSDFQLGESGVFQNGTRLTPVPASSGNVVLFADIDG